MNVIYVCKKGVDAKAHTHSSAFRASYEIQILSPTAKNM